MSLLDGPYGKNHDLNQEIKGLSQSLKRKNGNSRQYKPFHSNKASIALASIKVELINKRTISHGASEMDLGLDKIDKKEKKRFKRNKKHANTIDSVISS